MSKWLNKKRQVGSWPRSPYRSLAPALAPSSLPPFQDLASCARRYVYAVQSTNLESTEVSLITLTQLHPLRCGGTPTPVETVACSQRVH